MAERLTAPFPYDSPVSPEIPDPATGKMTRSKYFSQEYVDWFLELQTRTQQSAERIGAVALTAQSASISATPVPMPDLTTGFYRVSYSARISRAASTDSTLTVTLGWTRSTIALTQAGAAITGNSTSTQQNATLLLWVDANASITYATTYGSNGATTMQYELAVIVEAVRL